MPSISFAITACNEHKELERLLRQIWPIVRDHQDQIVIQLDSNATQEVRDIAKGFSILPIDFDVQIVEYPLNDDFASFKNNLKSRCSCDYIFQIDADEYLGDYYLNNIHQFLEGNPEPDVFELPRINIVVDITPEYINQQKWWHKYYRFPIEDDYREKSINFPDYQQRLFKNIPEIKWVNKVHERLVGYNDCRTIMFGWLSSDQIQSLSLIHVKTFDRQKKQNEFYANVR